MPDLKKFFNPKSIAIVGASTVPGKIGNAVLNNIISSGFKGDIYPINPKADKIEGIKCYGSLKSIGKPIDTAIIAIPAKYCLDIVSEAAELNIKNLIILTAGFKEIGNKGLELEKKITQVAKKHNINMLGPNCVGIMDTATPINASFSAVFPERGNIAFISQSGAMLVSIVDKGIDIGLKFSKIISLGNKALLNETDFINELTDDPNTDVILIYIEDVSDGAGFIEAAKKACKLKPVVVLKSGTSQAGAQAASSHTGALAGSDLAYEIAFEYTGIIRARTMNELFDLALAFSKTNTFPSGNKVSIVTNAGGPGIIAADAIEKHDLDMARFTQNTIEFLKENLPSESNIYNPVDVLGDANHERYHLALDKTLADPNTDCALVLICPTAVTDSSKTAQAIEVIKDKHKKPIFTSFMGGQALKGGIEIISKTDIPNYTFPEAAIQSLSKVIKYAEFKKNAKTSSLLEYKDVDKAKAASILETVLSEKRHVLLGSETYEVAKAYRIPAAPVKLATTTREAVRLADEIGYPVVLKVASPKIMHKTDVGGILLNLNSADEVREGFIRIMESVSRYMPNVIPYGIEVQKMERKGTEFIIGVKKDIQFGALIGFGLGGIYVNLIQDVSFCLANYITHDMIEDLISNTKAYKLLKGYRGAKPLDLKTVIETIGRTAQLARDFPEIAEMDINPVFVYENGVTAVDIKITISRGDN
ncbi:acetate--CoA ligase family protein [Peptococcaceae bacterium]|nr:acetate--CoA ligase family protein [Peptococcaceae bacterium]